MTVFKIGQLVHLRLGPTGHEFWSTGTVITNDLHVEGHVLVQWEDEHFEFRTVDLEAEQSAYEAHLTTGRKFTVPADIRESLKATASVINEAVDELTEVLGMAGLPESCELADAFYAIWHGTKLLRSTVDLEHLTDTEVPHV